LLRDRYERDAAAVKDLDELGKIGERSRQPVDLVNDDHIDLAGFRCAQEYQFGARRSRGENFG
jgi:hypothetical protein